MPRLSAAHAALDLTPRRFQLLLLLHDKGAMSQSDVHQAMGIDPSALVQLLNPLEAMGLSARRGEAADRRRHVVSLTAAGERRLVEAAEAQHELEEELLRALTCEQRRQLVALLLPVREGMTAWQAQHCSRQVQGGSLMVPDDFPARAGERPRTTDLNPHTQLDQNAPIELQDRLRDYALSLAGVRGGPSKVSVPGAVAFFLDQPPNAPALESPFGEWGHIHPHYDGSLHLFLPTADAERLIDLGWAEYHHVVEWGMAPPVIVMVYGPRDEKELLTIERIVEHAYVSAGGARQGAAGQHLAA